MEHTPQLPGLNDFLAALRFEGIPIGSRELLWLRHAFGLEPLLDRQSLHDLLACALIKHASHRAIFEALFEDWCPSDDSVGVTEGEVSLAPPTTPASSVPHTPAPEPIARDGKPEPYVPSAVATVSRPSRRLWCMLLLAIVVVGLGYAVVSYRVPEPGPTLPHAETSGSVEAPPQLGTTTLASEPVAQFWTWVPTFDIPSPPLFSPMWWAIVVAVLSLGSGAVLWWRYHSRKALPEPEASTHTGPAWLPLLTPGATGPALLNRDELRAAVWGVERFVSEDETRAVDLDTTVAATAQAGGLPTICFAHAVYPREIWLWRDAMVQDPTVDRVLAELENSLRRAGLPVRVGTFVDTPTLVRWREGQELSALVLEGHRQSALVVLLTDGYGMRLAAQSELEKHTLAHLLRAFSEWPRLTFVDCSYGAYGLATQVQAYGLRCIAPEAIPTWLGAGAVTSAAQRRVAAVLLGDLRVWAAATALAPDPVSDESALALRAHLGLALSPWACRDLRSAAESVDDDLGRATESVSDKIAWPPARRAELLNWLTQCYQEHGKVTEGSPLALALDYWIEQYRAASRQRQEHQSLLLPWQRTPAEQRARLEVALLELWRQPADATRTLYRLRGALGLEIRERLALLADWDSRGQKQREVVYLPWQEAEQPALIRWMLGRLGFGGSMEPDIAELHMPVKLSLALGVCAGLSTGALGAALWWSLAPAVSVLRPALPEALQALMIQDVHRTGPDTYRLVVGTPKQWRVATIPAHSVTDIQWHWQPQDNIQRFGQSELWRAGTLPQAIRGCEAGWPRRSLVVIQAEPTAMPARQLAIRLLDRGSADAVLLGTDWAAHVDTLLEAERPTGQQLVLILPPGERAPVLHFQGTYGVVVTANLQALVARLDFAGIRPLQDVWGNTQTRGRPLLRGGPEETTDPSTGITFVKVCGGTFTMGSDASDAYHDEKPPHPVTLSSFEISKTEITNARYRQFRQEHQGADTLPAVVVSWHEAQTFCASYGYALPTEAQWEYAARGGSTTRWSFGDDAAQLGDYAWFSDNSGIAVHPVGTKRPNPLGLYDMHGNAWEWVADCYNENAYQNRPVLIVDPEVGGNCQSRALRGGSAWLGPWYLRSAVRFRSVPVDRRDYFGFRCVRSPRRQP